MRLKESPISDMQGKKVKHVQLAVCNKNYIPLAHFEKRIMKQYGMTDALEIQNSDILNKIIHFAYRMDKQRYGKDIL